ncbi:MAG: cation-translocating P-type ATPase [Candidatus Magasanikbacteria bacterium]|jgi:Ca2+-transporting ATPase
MREINFEKIISTRATYLGLTSVEAGWALEKFGFNERARSKSATWLKRLWGIVSEPMIALIFVTAILYFFLGEKIDAVILMSSIIPILFLEYLQEQRTDNAISALDKLMVGHCRVYRDGVLKEFETKYIVPGDLVYLTAGDKVSADGYLLNSPGLQADESMLTGESVSVVKSEITNHEHTGEEHRLYQGTLITSGEGYLLVDKTGVATAYGHLGSLLQNIESKQTPLQQKINRLVRGIAIGAIASALLVAGVLTVFHGWQEGVLGGLAIAMSLIPEEFPVVFSVFLIVGVWRMSRKNALVREMEMVETLGSATVICTDKTGTLTEGRMSLEKLYFHGEMIDVKNQKAQSDLAPIITASLLALEKVPIDPIEIEMHKFAESQGVDLNKFFNSRSLVADFSFSAETKMVHHVWQDENDGSFQYTAGAPESVIASCALSDGDRKKLIAVNEQVSNEGMRVIAVACKKCLPQKRLELTGLDFVGFLVMSDPARAGVKEAIEICQNAGIRIIMITGDNKLTAHSIAEHIGLKHNEEIIGGDEIEKMDESSLRAIVKDHNIFARVRPEHKFRIVEALQKNGEVVAMTGDGVNDAPALKKADIGVAMGLRGTEVARSASGIVLLDDNFTTIVSAVHEGRRIYDNLRHAFMFLFSFHLPIIGLAVVPLFLGQPLIFLPIHIIFLELICDPVSVLGFEKEKARRGLMTESPRPVSEPIVNPRLWRQILWQGMGILAVCLGFYYYFGWRMGDLDLGRTMTFAVLVWSQILLTFFSREWSQVKSNRLMLYIVGVLAAMLAVALLFAPMRAVFHFATIPAYLYSYMIIIPVFVMASVSFVVSKK